MPMPHDPKPRDNKSQELPESKHLAEPVAKPSPSPDGHKPIPAGDLEVEKFNVTADTGGGD